MPVLRRRRILRILLVLLLVLIVAGRWFLSSTFLARQVEAQLQTLMSPLQLGGVTVGFGGTTLEQLVLSEPDHSEPWLAIKQIQVDTSLWGLLSGATSPGVVAVEEPRLRLRFAPDGSLATRFPTLPQGSHGPFPKLSFQGGQLVFEKQGFPELTLAGVKGNAQTSDSGLSLHAHAEHQHWGKWELTGEWVEQKRLFTLQIRSAGPIPVNMAMLRSLPFVPCSVWEQVHVAGRTPAGITLRYAADTKRFSYRVELAPTGTTVVVPGLDLNVLAASGGVVVADGVVSLRNVTGQAFAGKLSTDAALDFSGPETRLKFDRIEAEGLQVVQLPRRWNLPPQIEGRLAGKAQLDLTLTQGQPRFRGQGQVSIAGARVAGQPTAEPIRLEMRAESGGVLWRQLQRVLPQRKLDQKNQMDAAAPAIADWCATTAQQAAKILPGLGRHALAGVELLGRLEDDLLNWQWPRADAPVRYLDINLKMDNVDLEPFLAKLGVQLPIVVQGRASFAVAASLPLDSPGNLRLYRGDGRLQVRNLTFARLQLQELSARVRWSAGTLQLAELRAQLPGRRGGQGGFLLGQATIPFSPPGKLQAEIQATEIALPEVANILGVNEQGWDGQFAATFKALVPVRELGMIAAWSITGQLQAAQGRIFDLPLQKLQLLVQLERAQVQLASLCATLAGAEINGSARAALTGATSYAGRLQVKGNLERLANLETLRYLGLHLRGGMEAQATASGTLAPFTFALQGVAQVHTLCLNKLELTEATTTFTADQERLRLRGISLAGQAGLLQGEVDLPYHSEQTASAKLAFKQVEPHALVRGLLGRDVAVSGRLAGACSAQLLGAPPGLGRDLRWNLNCHSTTLRLANISLEEVHGAGLVRQGAIRYELHGKLLGGRLTAVGTLPLNQGMSATAQGESHWKLEQALLGRSLRWPGQQERVLPLRGRLQAEFTFRHRRDWLPEGQGKLVVDTLRWHQNELVGSIRAEAILRPGEMVFREVAGHLGTGVVRGWVLLSLLQPARTRFVLTFEHLDAARFLLPWLGEGGAIQGDLSFQLAGSLWPRPEGAGNLSLAHGKIGRVEVTELHAPLQWSYNPEESQLSLDLSEAHASAARGRLTGQAHLSWRPGGWDVQGQIRFANLEVRHLVGENGQAGPLGSGVLTGRLELSGRAVREWEDLSGSLEAQLRRVQPWGLPILQQLRPFLGVTTGLTFDSGDLRARLTNGVLRVERFTLEEGLVYLFVEGTVTLHGRLDLSVAASTGRLPVAPNLMRAFGLRASSQGPLPARLLAEARSLLTGRLLSFRVTGTVQNPTIQVLPLPLLTEDAIRFLLRQLPLP